MPPTKNIKELDGRKFRSREGGFEVWSGGFTNGEFVSKWLKVCMQNGFSFLEKRRVWKLFN